LYHRVKAIEYLSERMSLLLFADIDPRECGPWVENELNAGIDIGGRVLSNSERFGLRPWVLE
jgi:hypothetical protein